MRLMRTSNPALDAIFLAAEQAHGTSSGLHVSTSARVGSPSQVSSIL